MRAIEMLRRVCGDCREASHRARWDAVIAGVRAALQAQRLTLTEMGRCASPSSQPRYGIKKIDRLLQNRHLHRERTLWFQAIATKLVGELERVVVLLDWTQISGDFWALVASVPFDGRSVPILAKCHPKSSVGSRDAHTLFLRELREILPRSCNAVIVADGGFRSTFFDACLRLGFDYVIRLRSDDCLADLDGGRESFSALFERAIDKAQCLGDAVPYATSRERVGSRLVLGPLPPKAKRRVAYAEDYERKRACEPYLLATSLQNEPASAIVATYDKRMQIEETFRDTKSARFGWALEHSRTRSVRRFDILLLLATLASFVVVLVGAAAERKAVDRTLRASSVKRRVLSLFTLGNQVLRWCPEVVRLRDLFAALRRFQRFHQAHFPKLRWPTSEGRRLRPPLLHALFCADCGWQGPSWGWPK